MVIVEKYAIMHLRNMCVYFKIYWYTKHQTPKRGRNTMRKKLAVTVMTALLVSTLAGCSNNSATEQGEANTAGEENAAVEETTTPDRVLKFTDQNSEESPAGQWEKKFAELVKEYTKGHIQVDVYYNNTLCGYDIQPLQAGIADFLQYVPSSAGDLDSRLGAFDAPYIYRDAEHRMAVFDPFNSEPLKEINKALEDDGVMLLSAFNSGYRQITCNFPIPTLKEMKGAKIRVVPSDLYQQLFSAFGAAATPMAYSEVSTALITNVIDGQENPYSVIVTDALYEVQKYLMETNHLPTNHGLWMNLNTYNSLTPDQQEAIKKAAYDASVYMDSYITEKVEEYKQTCIDKGVEVIDAENGLDLDAYKEAAESVYDYFAEDWGDMPDMIRAVGAN